VLFIYRDEIYNENSTDKGMAELLVAKHRGGKTGTIRCAFVGKHQRFANGEAHYQNPQDQAQQAPDLHNEAY
jgi:replicative DNA helicase